MLGAADPMLTVNTDEIVMLPMWDKAAHWARRRMPPNKVDNLGMCQADYAQDIRMHVVQALRKHPGQARGYYITAGWTRARELARTAKRRLALATFWNPDVFLEHECGPFDTTINRSFSQPFVDAWSVDNYPVLEARSCLRVLENVLSDRDLALLESQSPWMGGKASRFHRTKRRIERLQQLARKAINGEEMTDSTDPSKMSDDDVKAVVPCFKVSYTYGDANCGSCPVASRCVSGIVADPKNAPVAKSTPAVLAKFLDISPDTANVIVRVRKGESLESAVAYVNAQKESAKKEVQDVAAKAAPPPAPPPPPPAAETKKAAEKVPEPEQQQTAPEPSPAQEPTPEPTQVEPEPPNEEEAAEENVTMKATKKKAPAKVAVKAAVKKSAPVKKTPPVKASPPAKPVPAKKKLLPQKPVTKDRAIASYDREMIKSDFARDLPDGLVLYREYNGKEHDLRVDRSGKQYVLDGKPWPTLYSATASIVGMGVFDLSKPGKTGKRAMSAWSAKRFWGSALKESKKSAAPAKKKKKS